MLIDSDLFRLYYRETPRGRFKKPLFSKLRVVVISDSSYYTIKYFINACNYINIILGL